MNARSLVPLALVLPAMLATTVALADDKATCLDAASKGQRLRDTHKLVQAREQLRVCAGARCPAVVQADCASWLAEVEKALPTVVLRAKNAVGADLVDVSVSVDGQPLVPKLDGQAVPMNAGPHTFHFEGARGGVVDQQVVVQEGEKNQAVVVVLVPPAPPPPVPPPPAEAATDAGKSSSPRKTLGWVLGGAGVVGLGLGAAFGIVALSDKNKAHCESDVCDPGTVSGIKSAALASDVGWIAGGVLLASGAALLLFAPSGDRHASRAGHPVTAVSVAPLLTASGGGLVLGGRW